MFLRSLLTIVAGLLLLCLAPVRVDAQQNEIPPTIQAKSAVADDFGRASTLVPYRIHKVKSEALENPYRTALNDKMAWDMTTAMPILSGVLAGTGLAAAMYGLLGKPAEGWLIESPRDRAWVRSGFMYLLGSLVATPVSLSNQTRKQFDLPEHDPSYHLGGVFAANLLTGAVSAVVASGLKQPEALAAIALAPFFSGAVGAASVRRQMHRRADAWDRGELSWLIDPTDPRNPDFGAPVAISMSHPSDTFATNPYQPLLVGDTFYRTSQRTAGLVGSMAGVVLTGLAWRASTTASRIVAGEEDRITARTGAVSLFVAPLATTLGMHAQVHHSSSVLPHGMSRVAMYTYGATLGSQAAFWALGQATKSAAPVLVGSAVSPWIGARFGGRRLRVETARSYENWDIRNRRTSRGNWLPEASLSAIPSPVLAYHAKEFNGGGWVAPSLRVELQPVIRLQWKF